MKIALITTPNSTNYGAVLQAFATKHVLSSYGSVKILNYTNDYMKNHVVLFRFSFSIHGFKMLAHDILRFPYRYLMLSKFEKFRHKELSLTPVLTSDALKNGVAKSFDVIVCGSDQIWNPKIVDKLSIIDPMFFLSFVPKEVRKFSYASSIGNYIYNNRERDKVKFLLEDFYRISTREKEGKIQLESILPNREVQHVLDPTLLLSKEEWLSVFDIKPKEPKEKYILVYSIPRSQLLRKAIAFYADKLDLKVVAIDNALFSMSRVSKQIRTASPEEFVSLFANASFIITDSFHGTCFAINFQKPFVSISVNGLEVRAKSLLFDLGIEKRLIQNEEDFDSLILMVDYTKVSSKLEGLRFISLDFFKDAML